MLKYLIDIFYEYVKYCLAVFEASLGKRGIIFLDRDGTIIKDKPYSYRIEDMEFLPRAVEGLSRFREMGFKLFVISNQAGIARGYYTIDDANKFNEILRQRLITDGIHIEKIYICPHHPDFFEKCDCRKPNPGMVVRAAREFNFNLSDCIYVGDKDCDIELGKNCGGTTFLINNGQYKTSVRPDYTVKNLAEVADILESKTA